MPRVDLLAVPISPVSQRDVQGVLHVLENLRDLDAREVWGLRDRRDPVLLANEVMHICAMPMIVFGRLIYPVYEDDAGAALIGEDPCGLVMIYKVAPGLVNAGICGTPKMTPATRALTKMIRDNFAEARRRGVRVAEINVLSEYRVARSWMRSLGGVESELGPIGANGEDYVKMIWRL